MDPTYVLDVTARPSPNQKFTASGTFPVDKNILSELSYQSLKTNWSDLIQLINPGRCIKNFKELI